MPAGVLSDRKEDRLGALVGERLEHGGGVARPWAVVERQHDLMVAQKVVSLEMLAPENRTAGRVNFDRAGDAERVWIVTFCRSRRRRCRRAGTARLRGGLRQLRAGEPCRRG